MNLPKINKPSSPRTKSVLRETDPSKNTRASIYGVTDRSGYSFWKNIDEFFIDNSKINLREKSVFYNSLKLMIRSGINFSKAVKLIAQRSQNIRLARILNTISYDMDSKGMNFSSALKKYPTVFEPMEVKMIEAGEMTGKIDQTLLSLSIQIDKSLTLQRNIRGAMVYPITIVAFAVLAMVLLMTLVVPKFVVIFTEFDTELPVATKILIWIHEFSQSYWIFILALVMLSTAYFSHWKNSDSGRRSWDNWLLHAPLIAPLVNNIQTTRISTNLGVLMESGIPVNKALHLLSELIPNTIISDAISRIEEKVRLGGQMDESFAAEEMLDPVLTEVINVGAQSGTMAEVLSKLGSQYQEEVDVQLAGVSVIIKPVVLVFVALLVVFMALSIFMPIFGMQEAFSNQ